MKAPVARAVDLSTLRWTGPQTRCPGCGRRTRVLWMRPPAVPCCARCRFVCWDEGAMPEPEPERGCRAASLRVAGGRRWWERERGR